MKEKPIELRLIYRIITYWENFSLHAFENTTQNFFQPTSLVLGEGAIDCSCCYTIRRDVSLFFRSFLPSCFLVLFMAFLVHPSLPSPPCSFLRLDLLLDLLAEPWFFIYLMYAYLRRGGFYCFTDFLCNLGRSLIHLFPRTEKRLLIKVVSQVGLELCCVHA